MSDDRIPSALELAARRTEGATAVSDRIPTAMELADQKLAETTEDSEPEVTAVLVLTEAELTLLTEIVERDSGGNVYMGRRRAILLRYLHDLQKDFLSKDLSEAT